MPTQTASQTPVLHASLPRVTAKPPPLENGDHLDQKTFHERYTAMPADFRAELIEGMVLVSSPMKRRHGRTHFTFNTWLGVYMAATPGTEGLDNATAILGDESEPQPDTCLYILPEHGGRCRLEENFLTAAPDWIGEIASASETHDLHGKFRDYERAGVTEYVVIVLRDESVRWFMLREGRYAPLPPDADGVYRSRFFPGCGSTRRRCSSTTRRLSWQLCRKACCPPSMRSLWRGFERGMRR